MPNVLLVDGDSKTLVALQAALESRGFTVTCCSSVASAVVVIRQRRPALIVCGLMMRGETGLDLLSRVRQGGLAVPFVLMTSEPRAETVVRAIRLGADDCLATPVTPETVVHVAMTYVGSPDRSTTDYSRRRAVEAMQIIGSRFREPHLSAAAVAREIGISLSHLSRVMKAHTGVGVVATIRQLRVKEAARLLKNSRLLVKEVAYAAGYRRVASCIRDFRVAFSCSPQEFRAGSVHKSDFDHKHQEKTPAPPLLE